LSSSFIASVYRLSVYAAETLGAKLELDTKERRTSSRPVFIPYEESPGIAFQLAITRKLGIKKTTAKIPENQFKKRFMVKI